MAISFQGRNGETAGRRLTARLSAVRIRDDAPVGKANDARGVLEQARIVR
jgi:hypothetical protein